MLNLDKLGTNHVVDEGVDQYTDDDCELGDVKRSLFQLRVRVVAVDVLHTCRMADGSHKYLCKNVCHWSFNHAA